jgi:hypothetical protein
MAYIKENEVRIMVARTQKEEPLIGSWYDSKDFPECFRVVAYDNPHDAVEIQYFDGEIEEIDYETWQQLNPYEIPEPEDASAPFEMEREDILDMLNEIENDEDLASHLRHIDDEESSWR